MRESSPKARNCSGLPLVGRRASCGKCCSGQSPISGGLRVARTFFLPPRSLYICSSLTSFVLHTTRPTQRSLPARRARRAAGWGARPPERGRGSARRGALPPLSPASRARLSFRGLQSSRCYAQLHACTHEFSGMCILTDSLAELSLSQKYSLPGRCWQVATSAAERCH